MGLTFALLAALAVALSNLCMRRGIDAGGSSRTYLVIQLFSAFLLLVFLYPVRTGHLSLHLPTLCLGIIGGILQGILMWGIGKSLEKGPAGLSIAILYTASIVPGVLLACLFGNLCGHPYTLSHGIGSLLVVGGLFWAGSNLKRLTIQPKWPLYALIMFLAHAAILTFLEWWAMLLLPELPPSRLLPWHISQDQIDGFAPTLLLVAALLNTVLYIKSRPHPRPCKMEILYGVLGGVTSGLCNFFLILAPQVAALWEKAMIFPAFAVVAITLCNVWAQLLYKERINWYANAVCVTGLVIGTTL